MPPIFLGDKLMALSILQQNKRADKVRTDLLKICVSKDETRLYLGGVIHYEPLKALCATDGHKAVILRSRYSENLKGLIIDPKTMQEIVREYPKLHQVVPDPVKMEKASFEFKDGHSIKWKRGKPNAAHFHLDKDGKGFISMENKENALFSVNSEFLKPLIGQAFHVAYHADSSALKPVLVSLVPDRFDGDVYLIMPLKV